MIRDTLAAASAVMLAAFTLGAVLIMHLLMYAVLPAPF